MTERRQFLAGTVVLAAGATLGVSLSTPAAPVSSDFVPQLFLYDQHFIQAREAAGTIAGCGIATAGFEGDLLHVWNSQLKPLWREGPATVAGLSNGNALFLLQTLAADHRLKLAWRRQLPRAGTQEPLYEWLLVPRRESRA